MANKFITQPPDQPVVLGKIISAYGILGWVKILSFSEEPKSIFSYQEWFLQRKNKWRLLGLEEYKPINGIFLAKLQGIDGRNIASLLKGYEIIVDANQLPILPEDEYYWKDLMGCQVINAKGCYLGKVISIIETGSNDVLIIRSKPRGMSVKQDYLVPFILGQVVKKVDLVNSSIEVSWDNET